MKSEKQFDAVQTMREIRDTLSAEIAGMSYEEERRFIDEQIKGGPEVRVRPETGREGLTYGRS